ncbi:MAG: hypothetical protein RIE08_07835 [Acidimicrobiales bacterium]
MARGRETFEKRLREKKRQEKAAAKAARKEERKDIDDTVEDEQALLERFRKLSESYAAEEIDEESFEERKAEIFEKLGIEAG